MQVLECCKESKVFKASNPYISAILSLMAEIYATSKLKLNLCFEIEMLFRSFGLTISETRVSKELTTRKRDMTTGVDYTLDKPAGETSGQLSFTSALPLMGHLDPSNRGHEGGRFSTSSCAFPPVTDMTYSDSVLLHQSHVTD